MTVYRVVWVGLAAVGCALLASCPSSVVEPPGAGPGHVCTAGTQQSCACLGGSAGVRDCNAQGTAYGACQCPSAATSASSSSSASSSGAGGSTGTCQCADPGLATPPYCGASVCGGTTGAGGSSTCAGHVYYAGMYPVAGGELAPSIWANLPAAGGLTSLDAGNAQCQAQGVGADHVCTLTEIQAAAAAHEPRLSQVPQGTTAWMQRTTPAYVEGLSGVSCTAAMVGQTDPNAADTCPVDGGLAPCVCTFSLPGPGGNCNNWQYATHHIADGEYYTFDQQGVPTYHLDNDTIFDPNDPFVHDHHTADFTCGAALRAILCCFPSCSSSSGG